MAQSEPPVKTKTLYRPVGAKELELIAQAEYRGFPPRLYFQPIFYPVLNQEYAEKIARDWNTKDEASGYDGYVTRFEVNLTYIEKFPIKTVGAQSLHEEYWIPAEEMQEFNDNIVGKIEVISTFKGDR